MFHDIFLFMRSESKHDLAEKEFLKEILIVLNVTMVINTACRGRAELNSTRLNIAMCFNRSAMQLCFHDVMM